MNESAERPPPIDRRRHRVPAESLPRLQPERTHDAPSTRCCPLDRALPPTANAARLGRRAQRGGGQAVPALLPTAGSTRPSSKSASMRRCRPRPRATWPVCSTICRLWPPILRRRLRAATAPSLHRHGGLRRPGRRLDALPLARFQIPWLLVPPWSASSCGTGRDGAPPPPRLISITRRRRRHRPIPLSHAGTGSTRGNSPGLTRLDPWVATMG